jgi:hypothetical protein
MTDFNDPERAAAIRRALGRLLDLLARDVTRELTQPAGEPTPGQPRCAPLYAAGDGGAPGGPSRWRAGPPRTPRRPIEPE